MTPEIQTWLDKAEEDWLAANWLLEEDSPVVMPAIFHIQQGVEKLLKGYLTSRGIRFERKHDLTYLLSLSPSSPFSDYIGFLEEISPFAVEIRYPGDYPQISRQQALVFLDQLRNFRDEVNTLLKSNKPDEEPKINPES